MFNKRSPPPFTEPNYTVEPPRQGPDSRASATAAAMAQCVNQHSDSLEDLNFVTYETVMHVQNEYGVGVEVRTYKATPHQQEQRRPSMARGLAFLGSMTLRRKSTEEQHGPAQMVDDEDGGGYDDEDYPRPSSFSGRITAHVKKSLSTFPFLIMGSGKSMGS